MYLLDDSNLDIINTISAENFTHICSSILANDEFIFFGLYQSVVISYNINTQNTFEYKTKNNANCSLIQINDSHIGAVGDHGYIEIIDFRN